MSTYTCIHAYLQRVVELSKQYLPQLSCGFSDSRVHVHYQDGAEFMAQHRNKFDVIITDSSDPVGKRQSLLSPDVFVQNVSNEIARYVSVQFKPSSDTRKTYCLSVYIYYTCAHLSVFIALFWI